MSVRRYTGTALRLSRHGLRLAADLLMPRLCVFCGTECSLDERALCIGCERDLPWLGPHCPRCAEPVADASIAAAGCGRCQSSPPPFTIATAALCFTFPVDAAIRALKFHGRQEYVPAFAAILEAKLVNLPVEIDGLLPVPLHWRRQLRRGFNQAIELTAPLARATGIPMIRSIVRVHPTPFQSGLPAPQRRASLARAFAARSRLEARHVLIVDDVMTTGTTARRLAETVLAAGAGAVSVLTLARAGQEGLNA